MICEHCGSKVADGDHACTSCGMDPHTPAPGPRRMAKVIPFRPNKKKAPPDPHFDRHRVRSNRRATRWTIAVIVAVCLVLPYVYPLLR